jgi:peptide/nickel transport system substrate-binding protein
MRGKPVPNRLKLLRDWTANGGGLAMIGGYFSFQGIDGRARWHRTAVEEAMPVDCLPYDDRIEVPEGFRADVHRHLSHPILKGVEGEWPLLRGANEVRIKKLEGVEVLASLPADQAYRGGAPALKRVVLRHVAEPAAQRLLIEKGDADIARNLSADQITGLAGNKDVVVTTVPQATLYYVGLNLKTTQFQNVKVRQALHYLVDYDGMVGSFLKGGYQVHQTFWPSGFWASLDENEYTFDPAKAKALLAEAGNADGFEVTLDTPNSSPFINIAQSIQSTMAQGGIKVTIVPAEQKTVLTKYRARQHQMLLINWGPDYMDPHTNADSFARNPDNSDNPKSKPLAWRNSWDIPEITKMTDAAVRERDAVKRKQMYKDLQKKVMDEGAFIIMFQETKQLAERSNVKNFVMGASADVVYYNLTTK